MSLNLESKNTHVIFDEWGYPVIKGDPKSINDTCGRLVLMELCYGFTPEIIKRLEALLIKHKGRDRIIRHPDNPIISSRDHHSYFYIYRKYTGRPLPDFPRMRGMNSWMKALTGNKRSEFFYYFWAIPGAYIGNAWLRFCRRAGKIKPERDNNWWIAKYGGGLTNGIITLYQLTKWQKLWGWIILNTIPAYALHIKAWQIYVMPPSPKKEKLKHILLKRVGKSNLMLRLLLGDTEIGQQDVDNYPHMTNYRPGVYLDESCRRDIHEMTAEEAEWNTYEKDLII